ncbi:hypothetical protein [Streptomyces sp. NBC_00102]|uniref:hypothetical protein n=1 Tax=Streptomyces sp. NBC_00102 TaxID=2975652 RepID=UPI0022561B7C|nr:hypothetical protein [Streptomyces sp. NBC_00102]MCX5397087.1 hypothetical protein [Streptomyces sp. NBC_00102]
MTERERTRYRYWRRPYDGISPVVEQCLRSPSDDDGAWQTLWHHLAIEGTGVSAESYAALPHLRDIVRAGDTAIGDRALKLVGAIIAAVHYDHEADDFIRNLAPVIVELKQMTDRRLADKDLPMATAMSLFRAHLAFSGSTVWSLAEYDFEDGFYEVGCPHCHLRVTIAIGIHGRYSAYRDWNRGDIHRRPLQPAHPADLSGTAAWMYRTAGAIGLTALPEGLAYLFGRAECPDCASTFVVADQYTAEHEPPTSPDGPLPPGGW